MLELVFHSAFPLSNSIIDPVTVGGDMSQASAGWNLLFVLLFSGQQLY